MKNKTNWLKEQNLFLIETNRMISSSVFFLNARIETWALHMLSKCCTELNHSYAFTFHDKYKHNCPSCKNSNNALNIENKGIIPLIYSCFLFQNILLVVHTGVGTSLLARQISYH
jgi:hypothetical protein